MEGSQRVSSRRTGERKQGLLNCFASFCFFPPSTTVFFIYSAFQKQLTCILLEFSHLGWSLSTLYHLGFLVSSSHLLSNGVIGNRALEVDTVRENSPRTLGGARIK